MGLPVHLSGGIPITKIWKPVRVQEKGVELSLG